MTRPVKGLAVAVVAALLLGGCAQAISGLYPPAAATDQGQRIRDLYDIVFAVGVVIFLFVEGLILWAVFRYRRSDQPHLPPQTHGNNTLELIWTAIPMAIVGVLFFVSWQTLNTVDARAADPALKIEVVGFQWQWQFKYPDAGINVIGLPDSPPVLHVPAGQTVELSLKSQDVIHAFYVPSFLFKRDVVPGKVNVFDFKVDQPGIYRGQCAEFCGLGHDKMTFSVQADTPADFQAWLAAQKATPAPSAAGSPAASGSPAAAAGGGQAGQTVDLAASNIAFDKQSLTAPANTPFTLVFDNRDAGIPHNVQIKDASGASKFKGDLVTGPAKASYSVPALPAGSYTFVCDVHTSMTGTLTV
ncbi:MAG: cytochrome c oxidase subunit II, partial [Candidatus Limnocylindrales bacterium]